MRYTDGVFRVRCGVCSSPAVEFMPRAFALVNDYTPGGDVDTELGEQLRGVVGRAELRLEQDRLTARVLQRHVSLVQHRQRHLLVHLLRQVLGGEEDGSRRIQARPVGAVRADKI